MSDLRFNVAQLLQRPVGATRQHEFDDPYLSLGDGQELRPVQGSVKLIRTKNGVLANAYAHGNVELECVRCLELFKYPVEVSFDEEYYATVHVTTGLPLAEPEEDDVFRIDSHHLIDLGEAVREYVLLALPIAPICHADCAGIVQPIEDEFVSAELVDERLAALKQLLN